MPQITLHPNNDTTLVSDTPTAVAGYDTRLNVGYYAPSAARRSLLSFILADLPADAVLTSATLALYVQTAAEAAVSANIHLLATTNWDEEFATWIAANEDADWDAPGGDYLAEPTVSFLLPTVTGLQTLNVLSLVLHALTLGRNTLDVILRRTVESALDAQARYISKDYPGYEPALTIEYTVPTPGGPPAAIGRSRVNRQRRRLRIAGG